MDSLNDLLKNKKGEPTQVEALKRYALDSYGVNIQVRATTKYYLITVPGAAIAHRLRMETAVIKERCNLDKKLVIHIGYSND